jgi:hypothetical protein
VGTLVLESVRRCTRRYRSGEGFTGASRFRDRSGSELVKLMVDIGRLSKSLLAVLGFVVSCEGTALSSFDLEDAVETVESEEDEGLTEVHCFVAVGVP